MQTADPLAQLHPLRQPPEPPWWPPAPGWWLVLGLTALALAMAAWLLWRRWRERRYRREAVARLDALYADCQTRPGTAFHDPCNRILKAVALRTFPRRRVASLHGEDWLNFLNRTSPGKGPPLFAPEFVYQLYRPDDSADRRGRAYRAARWWIIRHREQR